MFIRHYLKLKNKQYEKTFSNVSYASDHYEYIGRG